MTRFRSSIRPTAAATSPMINLQPRSPMRRHKTLIVVLSRRLFYGRRCAVMANATSELYPGCAEPALRATLVF